MRNLESMSKLIEEQKELIKKLSNKIEKQKPFVKAYKAMSNTEGLYSLKYVARLFDVSVDTLLFALKGEGLLKKGPFGLTPNPKYGRYFSVEWINTKDEDEEPLTEKIWITNTGILYIGLFTGLELRKQF